MKMSQGREKIASSSIITTLISVIPDGPCMRLDYVFFKTHMKTSAAGSVLYGHVCVADLNYASFRGQLLLPSSLNEATLSFFVFLMEAWPYFEILGKTHITGGKSLNNCNSRV